jgi:hypothetical protein
MTQLIIVTDESLAALPVGARIMLIYNDGSGGSVACKTKDGFVDLDGDDRGDLDPCDTFHFFRLPNDFLLWCEQRSKNPIKLPQVQA